MDNIYNLINDFGKSGGIIMKCVASNNNLYNAFRDDLWLSVGSHKQAINNITKKKKNLN